MTGLETFGINTATNAASGLIGMGIGAATAKWNDERQLKMQEKLQAMQEAGNKRMANYSQGLNKEMWDYTNVENQVKHMKAAGINPALMYGQGGGGGTTANGGNAGSVSAGSAPTGGGEMGMGIEMGMQLQLMNAQKEVLLSQAKKNEVDAAKTAGVDTELQKASIERAWQGLANDRNTYDIQRLQETMMNLENYKALATQNDAISYIGYQTKLASKQLVSAAAQANVDQATVQDRIKIIQETAIGAVLGNELTKSNVQVNDAQIKKWAQEISQGWQGLDQNNRRIKLQAWEAEIRAQFPGLGQTAGKLFNNVLEGIDEVFENSKGTHRTYDVPKDIKH